MTRMLFPRILLTCVLSVLLGGVLPSSAETTSPATIGPTLPGLSHLSEPQTNDFVVVIGGQVVTDEQKYLTYGWNGWSGGTVRWRYNDANRASTIVGSSAAAVTRIQSAMAKWSAVCNVRFIYDGATTTTASLATGSRDGVNVIAWTALTGNTTGITYTGASGFSGSALTIDESDMVLNYQFNPNFDSTLVHEVGHMIGLKHSNQESTVMSGPNTAPDPSTSYSGLTTLQADDINGCRALYGASASAPAPVASVAPAALAFADVTVGSTGSGRSVTLTNTGNAALSITNTVVSGADFALVATTCGASNSVAPGGSCTATARFAPTASGTRNGTLTITHNASPAQTIVALSGNGLPTSSLPARRDMVEYRYEPLDYYFITSRDAEKSLLDASSGWTRTGASFPVYASPQTGTRSVTRFYFDGVARGGSRGSHFYTLLDSDLVALANQNPAQSTAPGFAQNEGIDSYAHLPLVAGVGGFCASGQAPVYRLFRGAARFPDDPNHRYTTLVATYNAFVAQGWDGEGVNFCVPTN